MNSAQSNMDLFLRVRLADSLESDDLEKLKELSGKLGSLDQAVTRSIKAGLAILAPPPNKKGEAKK